MRVTRSRIARYSRVDPPIGRAASALVDSGALTPAQALEAVDKSIEAGGRAEGEEEEKVAKIVGQCLEGVRETLVEMLN